MEGKEAIINKIISDAESKASTIIKDAQNKADSVISEANAWAEEYKSAQDVILKKECNDIVERKLIIAELDSRKMLLKEKQDLISYTYDRALELLRKISKEDYLKLVSRLLMENAEEGDVITLSDDDVLSEKDILSIPVVEKLKLKIANKKGAFIGGIILSGSNCDKDLSFSSLIKSEKDENSSKIAELLF